MNSLDPQQLSRELRSLQVPPPEEDRFARALGEELAKVEAAGRGAAVIRLRPRTKLALLVAAALLLAGVATARRWAPQLQSWLAVESAEPTPSTPATEPSKPTINKPRQTLAPRLPVAPEAVERERPPPRPRAPEAVLSPTDRPLRPAPEMRELTRRPAPTPPTSTQRVRSDGNTLLPNFERQNRQTRQPLPTRLRPNLERNDLPRPSPTDPRSTPERPSVDGRERSDPTRPIRPPPVIDGNQRPMGRPRQRPPVAPGGEVRPPPPRAPGPRPPSPPPPPRP